MLHSRDDPRSNRVFVPEIRADPKLAPDDMRGPAPWMDKACNEDVMIAYLVSLGVDDAPAVSARLFSEYRALPDVLGASWLRLYRLVGPRLAGVLRSTRVLLERAHREQMARTLNLAGSENLVQFLLTYQGWLPAERMTAIYVDSGSRLIRVETLSEGNIRETSFDSAAAIRLGLEIGAAGVILVHNHPSGIAIPSEADKKLTATFAYVAEQLHMPLLQHVIVARGTVEFLEWPYR